MKHLKVLATISKIQSQAFEIENNLSNMKAEKAIELVHELRLRLKDLEAEIYEQFNMDPLERRLAIQSIVNSLKEEGKENGFNNAQMFYTQQFLYDLKDKEFALELARSLANLYPEKRNPQWLEFINTRTLVSILKET